MFGWLNMPKKFTKEFVEQTLAAEGYKLLDKSYGGGHAPMAFRCPKGHQHKMSFSSFRAGSRCGVCSGKFLTHDHVQAAFQSEGYRLLETFKNASKKMRFECSQGHRHEISWSKFNNGKRCAYCKKSKVRPEDVVKAFADDGYKLLGDYKHCAEPIPFICPSGHRHQMSWNSFRRGVQCAYCQGKIIKHKDVEKEFEKAGYKLRSHYKNSTSKLKFTCNKGHDWSISWTAFYSLKQRCAICARNIPKPEEIQKLLQKIGYELLGEYQNSKSSIPVKCPKGHLSNMYWSSLKKGHRCQKCSSSGFDVEKPATLYYIRFDLKRGSVYKIGITNRTIEKRFIKEKVPYVVVAKWVYARGKEAIDRETHVLRKYKRWQYQGDELKGGNTECFTRDVLGMENGNKDSQLIQLPLLDLSDLLPVVV